MNLKQKLVILERALQSISRHDDEDAAVVSAALAHIDAMVKTEREAIDERVAARISDAFAAEKPAAAEKKAAK